MIAPDQRGYNESDKPEGIEAYRVETLADDVAALIGALGYQQVESGRARLGRRRRLAGRSSAIPSAVRRFAVIDTPHPQARDGFESKEETITWFRTFMQLPWIPEIQRRASATTGCWRAICATTSRPGTFPEPVMDLFRSAWDQPGARTATTNWYRAAFRYPATSTASSASPCRRWSSSPPNDAFIPGDVSRAQHAAPRPRPPGRAAERTHWVIQEEPDAISRLLVDFFREPPAQPAADSSADPAPG